MEGYWAAARVLPWGFWAMTSRFSSAGRASRSAWLVIIMVVRAEGGAVRTAFSWGVGGVACACVEA